jgi:3-oxoacyl-[acyl-carrier-protein] synthase-3
MGADVGIVGTGIYIPETYMTARDIAEATGGAWTEEAVVRKLGIRRKPVPGREDGTQEMGARAALDVLRRTGVDPMEIDVIISIGEEWKEFPLTTTALYIQDRIGARNAWGIDVANRCCTTVSALKIAKDLLVADEEIDTVLIAGGYRNGDFLNYKDRDMSMMFNLGAGGGAMLLRKGHGSNHLLGSHIIADGTLARAVGVEVGGTEFPLTANNAESPGRSLRVLDAKLTKERLNAVSGKNWMTCISEALRKSKLTIADIDYLAALHMKPSAHADIMERLGLREDQSIYLSEYGHIGQIDQILSLHLALQEGRVKDGDVVAMLAAGIGYVWASTIIRWGESLAAEHRRRTERTRMTGAISEEDLDLSGNRDS